MYNQRVVFGFAFSLNFGLKTFLKFSKAMRVDKINDEILKVITEMIGHDNTTYSNELDDIGQFLFQDKFRGVKPINKIPQMSHNQYCILNLDRHDEPGSHWIGVVMLKNNKMLVYDSFGRKTKIIAPTLINTTMTEQDAEQDDNQDNCGQRCLSFLYLYDQFGEDMAKRL